MSRIWLSFGALLLGCSGPPNESTPLLTDLTTRSKLDHVYENGMQGDMLFIEIVGAGVGALDFDRDGDMDLVFTQAGPLGEDVRTALWENRWIPEGHVSFVQSLELPPSGYGMGVAAADFDNDGWTDLYLTQFGADQLLRNDRGQRFIDVTRAAGIAGEHWSTSAAFVDFDRDGDLDLFVAHYVEYTVAGNQQCYNTVGMKDYCGPNTYPPARDTVYRNKGDGTFVNVTDVVGIDQPGSGLGVVTADFNGDHWPDFYVANDQMANHLWLNDRGQRFVEQGLFSGSAVNHSGVMEASMGVDIADVDHDGDYDLLMTHLLNETNTLYLNDGSGRFADSGDRMGLAQPSIGFTGFGMGFFDVNLDGWHDAFVANGEVRIIVDQKTQYRGLPLAQINQLVLGSPAGFTEAPRAIGPLADSEVSRGLAMVDLDNDGDRDIVVANNTGPAQVIISNPPADHHWIGFVLQRPSGSTALGTQVRIQFSETTRWSLSRSDGSYLSANDPRILFGLGQYEGLVSARIIWPNGAETHASDLAAGRYHRFTMPDPEAQGTNPSAGQ